MLNYNNSLEILNRVCKDIYGVEYLEHDCKRDKYGQDSCPVCDGEEIEIPVEFEEELVPAEESWSEHDLTKKEIEEESKKAWI